MVCTEKTTAVTSDNRIMCSCKGGVSLRVCLALVTLLAVGALIFVALDTFSKRQDEHHRKAVHMSEQGLERSLQRFGMSHWTWKDGFERTYVDEDESEWYEVTIQEIQEDGTALLVFESTGGSGGVRNVIRRAFELVVEEGDTLWRPRTF